jgi:hypothetical protein
MFSITVDKVDKRRRSIDFSADVAVALHERIQSDSADHERVIGKQSVIPPPPKPSLSPIEEEDEDQLSPFPSSPRRSPSGSPAHSPRVSPSPSPNPSMSCLEPGLRSSSHDTLLSSGFGSAPKQTDGILLARNWMCYDHPFIVRVHFHIRIDDRTCYSAHTILYPFKFHDSHLTERFVVIFH